MKRNKQKSQNVSPRRYKYNIFFNVIVLFCFVSFRLVFYLFQYDIKYSFRYFIPLLLLLLF